jgi:hypothetical protein
VDLWVDHLVYQLDSCYYLIIRAKMADAIESLRQNVEQEAPDELAGRERHCAKPLPAVAVVVLVSEDYAALIEADQAAV